MPDTPLPTHVTKLRVLIASVFLFTATMLTFVNAVNAGFVNWDDDVYVTANPYIQHLTPGTVAWLFSHMYYYAWTPLTLLSHALDVAVWGMEPRGHHLTNVVLHSFNAVWMFWVGLLVFALSREQRSGSYSLLDRVTSAMMVGSVVAAFLFAAHPLRVEPVAWVSGRKDVLCLFFLLPAFGSYLLWRLKGRERYLAATHVLFVLALLSKPLAVVFPFILMLVDAWWLREESKKVDLLSLVVEGKLLLFLLGVAVAIVTFIGAGRGPVNVVEELTLLDRFFLPAYAMAFYLWKTIVPLDLSPVYPEVPRLWLYLSGLVFVGVTYGCLVLMGKQRTGAGLAFFSYVALLLPVFLGLASGAQPIADRYTYISMVSIFLFVGGCVSWVWSKSAASPGKWYQREALAAVVLLLCGISAYRTLRHVAVWNNSVALWTQAVRYAPATPQEYEARRPYIRPNYPDAFTNLGTAYYDAGDSARAMDQFRHILSLDTCNADAHYNLGTLEYERGNPEASKRRFELAIACDSTYAKAYYNLGIIYSRRDSTAQALAMFQKAARLGMLDAQRILSASGYRW